MYPTTRDFLRALELAGELQRVAAPTSPVLEIAQRADQESKLKAPSLPANATRATDPRFHHLGGKALLFENVPGADMPVLINQFGSYRRMEMALGVTGSGGLEALAARIGSLAKPQPPRSLAEIIAKLREFAPLLRIPPKRRRGRGLCQEVVHTGDRIDLTRIPILRCWPMDGDFAALGYPANVNDHIPDIARGDDWNAHFRGRYITLAGIHTIHADDRDNPKPASHNIGMYRVQLLAHNRVAMHWHMHHDGARHWRSWKKLGKPMPVAIVLGGESVLPYAATAPLPPGISELLLAGFLNGSGIPLCRAHSVPLWVPANAEIVIEGYASHEAGPIGWDPRDSNCGPLGPGAVFEGPFGDHTGFYSLPDRYPIVTVTAVTHRRDPIYPTTVVGLPPQEDYFMGKATERLFLPLLKTIVHDIEDYDLPMFGVFHSCVFVKIKKEYPLQGRRVMSSIWGAGQMAWTKLIFVVDDDVDVHDHYAVLKAAALHCHPARDLTLIDGPLDILDHAAPRVGAGSKLGFDCTTKVQGEQLDHATLAQRPMISIDHAEQMLVAVQAIPGVRAAALPAELAYGWLFISVIEKAPDAADLLMHIDTALTSRALPTPSFIILLGPAIDPTNTEDALFHWCAHTDPRRDMLRAPPGPVLFDATPKSPGPGRQGLPTRAWPPLVTAPVPSH